jgi:hypothetical protein
MDMLDKLDMLDMDNHTSQQCLLQGTLRWKSWILDAKKVQELSNNYHESSIQDQESRINFSPFIS